QPVEHIPACRQQQLLRLGQIQLAAVIFDQRPAHQLFPLAHMQADRRPGKRHRLAGTAAGQGAAQATENLLLTQGDAMEFLAHVYAAVIESGLYISYYLCQIQLLFIFHASCCGGMLGHPRSPTEERDVIKKILIANRGEIAVRIVRACAEMGIRSVAIYSDADRYALHVKRADESYNVGSDPLAGYLNARQLVDLAVETGCDAVHPGYGFLSENPELARICAERGIRFIGPSADVIARMGDKTEARRAMIAAGVPVTPGSAGNLDSLEAALEEADRVGYPVMLKATSGGGGRGIRRCNNSEELQQAWPRVISEATKAFGSADVFLEKCIVNPKHIEAQ